ncbi:hypothetical protein KFK09_024010 [Dendrobium nobile]|uniref:Uncharacterized protein n=1 Tax=Dendrobium nobile TaxID=94219 RepID=A0A8T3ACV8_DENNO|nr:hypothetical protein KFK09_024010 [Dendrobium nobile]
MIGHDKKECDKSYLLNKDKSNQMNMDLSKDNNEKSTVEDNQPSDDKLHKSENYGPWMMVNYGKKYANNLWNRRTTILMNKNSKISQQKQYVAVKKPVNTEPELTVLSPAKKTAVNTMEKVSVVSRAETESLIPINNSFNILKELEDGEINENNTNVNPVDTVSYSEVPDSTMTASKEELIVTNSIGISSNSIGTKGIEDSSQSSKRKKNKQLKDLGPINASTRSRRMEMEEKARKRSASLYLKEVVKNNGVCFVGLVETKITSIDRSEVDALIGNNWDFYCVPSSNLSGGIIILWNTNYVNFSVEESSTQMVKGEINLFNNIKWKVVTIYGSTEVSKRRDLWNMLDNFSNHEYPIVIGGDFNCLLCKEDKIGGRQFSYQQGARDMEECLLKNDLHEVSFIGPRFTWCNNKIGGARILERLDRCFVNSIALSSPFHLIERHLARIASDHCPILLQFQSFNSKASKMIKFKNCWASYQASFGVVKKEWCRNYQGNYSQILNKKFKRSLKSLFYWRKFKLKDLNKLKEDLMEEIMELQNKEASNSHLTEQEYRMLKEKVLELNSTLARLNTWWKQRAKVNWLKEGDGNSRFFHNYASARRNVNKIIKIKDEDGNTIEDQDHMEEVFMRFFQKKWEIRKTNLVGWPDPTNCLTEQERSILEADLSMTEVLNVLKQLEENTSPDSMAWESLKGVLEYFKFPPHFSMLIMDCVVNPMFSIIINGNCSNWIQARSGFWQGFPLSPILFILCSQLLSNAFHHSSCGIKLCLEGPRISHLLYADDVIMFSKANKKEVLGVKRILHKFCEWTGQKINYSKSLIMFGKHVESRRKRCLSRIMGFKYVKEFLYLGVKMALRRMKKEDFQFIIDKAFKKLNQWGNKYLSLSGKIILVKSILLALPLYHSTHSLIPRKILAYLDKISKNFIWDKKNGAKGLHYVNWNDMCKPIENGGRGIHSNLTKAPALHARLAWRFIQEEKSLLHSVMDIKYGNKLMKENPNGNKSTAFKILNEGFNSLYPIVKWDIANGKSVDAFKDIWILDKSINNWPTYMSPVEDDQFMVEDFISNGNWDEKNLKKVFGKELVDMIMKIQISEDKIVDSLVLINQNSGMSIPGLIRKAKVNSRVENFLWRLKKNAIPSMHFLCYRRIAVNAQCPRGCESNEDMEHIVCGCSKIKEIIQLLNCWGFGFPLFISSEQCLIWLENNVSTKRMMVNLYCTLVFLSWKSRNKRVHGGIEDNSSFIASEAIVQASISNKFSSSNLGFWDVNQSSRLSNTWHPPPPNWIKANVDASLSSSYKAGIAAVFRDNKGRFLYAYGKSLIHWDIGQLESLAIKSIKEEIKEWMFNYNGILIEGDNSNIISFFKKAMNNGMLKDEEWEKGLFISIGYYISDAQIRKNQPPNLFKHVLFLDIIQDIVLDDVLIIQDDQLNKPKFHPGLPGQKRVGFSALLMLSFSSVEGSVEVRSQHLVVVICQLQKEAKGDRFSALLGWQKGGSL